MKEVKVVAVSDIHGELGFRVNACDILTISGDICPVVGPHSPTRQRLWIENDFIPWCQGLLDSGAAKDIVFIPGNHDFVFQRHPLTPMPEHVHLLIDSGVEVSGVKVYGTPWVPRFGNWAFMLEEFALKDKYAAIPAHVDILLTHGPAYGICDTVAGETETLGSTALLAAIREKNPVFNLFGHIHTGSHELHRDDASGTVCVNVSLLDEEYAVGYRPFEFSIFTEET